MPSGMISNEFFDLFQKILPNLWIGIARHLSDVRPDSCLLGLRKEWVKAATVLANAAASASSGRGGSKDPLRRPPGGTKTRGDW